MNALLLFHVEADIVDAVIAEEAVHPLRLLHGIGGEHRDAVEGHIVAMQSFNPLHRQGVGTAPVAEAAVGVVNLFRTIHADAHHDAVAVEAIAPGVVDQRGVGLHVLGELQPFGTMLSKAALQDHRGLVVPPRGQGEGFAGMPNQRKFGAGVGALEDALHQQR